MKIRNINELYGQPVVFTADTLNECKQKMAAAIEASFPSESDNPDPVDLEEGRDYEMIELTPQPKRGRPPAEGETATGHIHIRTTLRRKSAYVRAARPKKLAEWITEHLDKAASYKPESP